MPHPFPHDFRWGAATASYQVEGGIERCDWAQAAREGRVPPCGSACDHYRRFREDIALAATLGHTMHRFSVEWARIEPEEGRFDEREIMHYREVLTAIRAHDMEPSITILHFTLPLWYAERGGWEHPNAPRLFARYAAYVVERLGDLCTTFATLNEPMVVAGLGYVRGRWPPFHTRAYVRYLRALYHMAKGHRAAYHAIRAARTSARIGIVKHTVAFRAAGKNPFHHLAAWCMNLLWTRAFMSLVHHSCDWIGVNYYQRRVYGDTRALPYTDMGWRSDPEGIADALLQFKRYRKPVYVAEAGCADASDRFRASYIRDTVRGMRTALAQGVDLRGYCYWSLLDNYEWAEGFEKHFGLVEVDYDTFERRVRPSALLYREICRTNGGVVEGDEYQEP